MYYAFVPARLPVLETLPHLASLGAFSSFNGALLTLSILVKRWLFKFLEGTLGQPYMFTLCTILL